jgi:two-component system CheB/CheR fusion protein
VSAELTPESPPVAANPDAPNPGHPHGPTFPVVGVGASAGGLEAFTELVEHLPPRPGLALVLALHLDPRHKSQMAEILANVTPLPVREVAEGTPIERDHIYVIPPNTNMALTDGRLTLTPRQAGGGPHMPIDYLFRSLAAIHKGKAIGVVLSGGGTDGALGAQEIKGEGGITFAQDERTARHPSMPRAAVQNGCVDYVLPPRDIARQLARLARHAYTLDPGGAADVEADEDAVGNIIALMRTRAGVDFTHYKRSTIRRRILRRMALRGLESLADYHQHLREDRLELERLYEDFLIRVTQFFRDPEAFAALKAQVLPALVDRRRPTAPLRVWVAGCATGEEVYSLAITLLEYLEARPAAVPIKVLATDLNETALEKARAGVFLDNIEIDVSPERLRRFFVRLDGHYQIAKAVRDLCVFSRHNLAGDPPFSHLDLVSCRNVLI